jgi:hypothetical protein
MSFLGLIIDNTLSWKSHIDWLMSKLSSACYVIRAVKPYVTQETLRMIYFSYVHSVMTDGIIFWGNSHSIHIFRLQKRTVRIITNSTGRDSCRELFRNLNILPLQSQYICSLLLFMANNRNEFKSNSEIHGVNTRYTNSWCQHKIHQFMVSTQDTPIHGINTRYTNSWCQHKIHQFMV